MLRIFTQNDIFRSKGFYLPPNGRHARAIFLDRQEYRVKMEQKKKKFTHSLMHNKPVPQRISFRFSRIRQWRVNERHGKRLLTTKTSVKAFNVRSRGIQIDMNIMKYDNLQFY